MVGSFVRFFFTRCEESLNSLVRCAHSFVRASRNSWRKIVRTHQPWSNLYLHKNWPSWGARSPLAHALIGHIMTYQYTYDVIQHGAENFCQSLPYAQDTQE